MLHNLIYLVDKCPEETWELKVRDHIERNLKGDTAEECESLCLCVQRRGEGDDKSCEDEKDWEREGEREKLDIICYR